MARNGGTPTPLPTLARTDGLHYDASDALTQSGTYTFRLQGVTLTGKTVATDSTPLVLALTPLMLIAGDQIPQGPAVAVPNSWPDHPVVTDMVTDCGTSVPQHFSGASGTCVYTKAGAFTVTGKFTDPTGTPNASTAPLAVSIQTLALAQATLVPMVGGQPLAALVIDAGMIDGERNPIRPLRNLSGKGRQGCHQPRAAAADYHHVILVSLNHLAPLFVGISYFTPPISAIEPIINTDAMSTTRRR